MLDIRTGKEISRRDFGKGIAAILAAGCAPSVMGGMMRNVGARNAAMFGGIKHTAKDYVQDGLIAMWDGIENAGWGNHNPNATSWIDLTQNGNNLNVVSIGGSGLEIGDDYVSPNASVLLCSSFNILSVKSFEYVVKPIVSDSQMLVVKSSLGSGPSDFGLYNSKNTQLAAWGNTNDGKYISETIVNTKRSISSVIKKYLFIDGIKHTSFNSGGDWPWTRSYNICVMSNPNVVNIKHGNAYCLRFYNRELEDGEVAYNYSIDKERFGVV